MLVAWLERGQDLYQNVGRMLEYDREPGANILRYDHHGRRQAELLGPPGKLAVIKGCDAVARLVAGVVQRVREIDARLAVGERLFHGITALDGDASLLKQVSDNAGHLGLIEAVVAARPTRAQGSPTYSPSAAGPTR